MAIQKIHQAHAHVPFNRSQYQPRAALTAADRAEIEQLLCEGVPSHSPYPALLSGFLRHRLKTSQCAPEPAPMNLVTSGRLITYMISGGGAQSDVLTFERTNWPGALPVASLLGATLIGMQRLQKSPLLCESGDIKTVVVLGIEADQTRDF